MLKKLISGLFIIFAFICTVFNGAQATTDPLGPHWEAQKIKVYIPPKDAKTADMRRAFNAWQEASYGKIKFVFVQNGPADIDVVFTDRVSGDETLGSYRLTKNGNTIKKAEIKIATKKSDIKKYSNDLIYTTMLHEIGHVLGLSHIERKKICIMYSPVSAGQSITKIDTAKLYKLNGWSWRDK